MNELLKSNVFTEIPLQFSGCIYRSVMPFGPFDENDQILSKYQEHEIDLVVVLVEEKEITDYVQDDLISLYHKQGMDVIHLPIPDQHIPLDIEAFQETLNEVSQRAREGQNIVIHCLAGIGRTGIFLACLARQEMGLDGQEAVRWVREAVPNADLRKNKKQERFIHHWAD